MRTGMHMTIQDYFGQSDLQRLRKTTSKGEAANRVNGAIPFSKALSAAQSSPPNGVQGWTIRDYIERPISSRPSIQAGRVRTNSHIAMHEHPVAGPTSQRRQPAAQIPSTTPEISPKREGHHPAAQGGEKGRIQASIEKAADRFDLPPALIEAVIKAESDYDVRAVSPAGAQGLMQLMPATARELGVQNPFDLDQNIHGGARYLRNMLDRFKGDIKLALSAYNAGPGTVAKYNGNVPYPETQDYIQRVMKYTRRLSSAAKGFS